MTENDIKLAVYDRLDELLIKCCENDLKDVRMPDIEFYDNKLAAGYAHYGRWAVSFNLPMFRENYDSMIHETVAHELAHLVVHHRWKKAGRYTKRPRPHGSEWKYIMSNWFGVDPQTTHDYCTKSTNARRQKRWQAPCENCGFIYEVSTTIQMRMAMGQQRSCTKCRGRVHLNGKEA